MLATICLTIGRLPHAPKCRFTLELKGPGVDLDSIDITDKSSQHVYYRIPYNTLHQYFVRMHTGFGKPPMDYHPCAAFVPGGPQTKIPIGQLVQDGMVTAVS